MASQCHKLLLQSQRIIPSVNIIRSFPIMSSSNLNIKNLEENKKNR